ncbi:MAG: hypothetical protein LCH41_01140 [Armatimonadetes bacterium]|nr:hypothetical protein [Armatimonadota bacterium]
MNRLASTRRLSLIGIVALFTTSAFASEKSLQSIAKNEQVGLVIPYNLLKDRELDVPNYPVGELALTYLAGASLTRQTELNGVRVFYYDARYVVASQDRLRSAFESWVNTLAPQQHEVGRRRSWRLKDFPDSMTHEIVYEAADGATLREAISGQYGSVLMLGYEVQDGAGKLLYSWFGPTRTREPNREPVPQVYPDVPSGPPAGKGIPKGELNFGKGEVRTLRDFCLLAWAKFGRTLSIDRRLQDEEYFISGGFDFETFRQVIERINKTEPVFWYDPADRTPVMLGQATVLAHAERLEKELGSDWQSLIKGEFVSAPLVLPPDSRDREMKLLNLPEYRARVRVGIGLMHYVMRPVSRLNDPTKPLPPNEVSSFIVGWN